MKTIKTLFLSIALLFSWTVFSEGEVEEAAEAVEEAAEALEEAVEQMEEAIEEDGDEEAVEEDGDEEAVEEDGDEEEDGGGEEPAPETTE